MKATCKRCEESFEIDPETDYQDRPTECEECEDFYEEADSFDDFSDADPGQ